MKAFEIVESQMNLIMDSIGITKVCESCENFISEEDCANYKRHCKRCWEEFADAKNHEG